MLPDKQQHASIDLFTEVQRLQGLIEGLHALLERDQPGDNALSAARHMALEASYSAGELREAIEKIEDAEVEAEQARRAHELEQARVTAAHVKVSR